MTRAGELAAGILNWLEAVRYGDEGWGRWKYNRHMCRPYGLQCCGSAVSLLNSLGALDQVTASEKGEGIAFYQSCQDPQDGYFKDPLVTDQDRSGAAHSWEHIWMQMSGIAGALRTLGGEPTRPLPGKRFADLSAVDAGEWTLSLDWRNPWMVGEEWAAALTTLWRSLSADEQRAGHPAIERAMAAYEGQIVDPDTGMPSRRGCGEPAVAMAGLFKTMTAHLALKRPVPWAERAIDTTLALQKADGEFGRGRDMCINWDALWVLRELDRQLEGAWRHGDITAAGAALVDCLLKVYHKPDGGFAFHGEHCLQAHNSIRTSEALPESDMLGTSMCLRCVAYVDEWGESTE